MGVAGTICNSGLEGVVIFDEWRGWDIVSAEGRDNKLGVPDRDSERTRRRSTVVRFCQGGHT
jgi:hypothetical protein